MMCKDSADSVRVLFTVFTPTYNRDYSLPRLFNSLRKQTVKNFEWLIVDDGSTDNTSKLVEQWKEVAGFTINYYWQANQGKHIALNRGAQLAKGELFVAIDSDDEIIEDTLRILGERWARVTEEEKKYVAGILFVSKNQFGQVVGDKFPRDGVAYDVAELLVVKKLKGDKASLMRTEVLRRYPFPENIKNVLVPEMFFIHQLSHDWKLICINEVLRIYWVDERDDHLGNSFVGTKSYKGIRMSYLALLNYSSRLFLKAPRTFLANTAYYVKTSFYIGVSMRMQLKDIKTAVGRALWFLALPAGYVLYLKEKRSESYGK